MKPMSTPSTASALTEEASDNSSDENWDGGDYITRCLCALQHNDDLMIQCDKCEYVGNVGIVVDVVMCTCSVWQHMICMGIDKKKVPENYICEKCSPRPLKLTPEAVSERVEY